MWPVSVKVGGVAVDLAGVVADVVIRHGRADVYETAEPSSAQISLLDRDHAYVRAFTVGAALEIATAGPTLRFKGAITDATLDDDDLTVIGVGPLATLAQYTVGAGAWPSEPWSARVARVFTEAGLAALLRLQVGIFDPTLAARAAGAAQMDDYLQGLVPAVGGVVCDTPDGLVLVQALGARNYGSEVVLDPADVAYSPPWEQTLEIYNQVSVVYAGGTATATDAASVAAYGPHPVSVQTEIANLTDAQTRANELLARAAFPRWKMTQAPLLAPYGLAVGSPVKLTMLPAASPYTTWEPCLEGWTDSIQGEQWHAELALSDPLVSGLVLRWADVPVTPAYRWNTIDPTTRWRDALTPEDLAA